MKRFSQTFWKRAQIVLSFWFLRGVVTAATLLNLIFIGMEVSFEVGDAGLVQYFARVAEYWGGLLSGVSFSLHEIGIRISPTHLDALLFFSNFVLPVSYSVLRHEVLGENQSLVNSTLLILMIVSASLFSMDAFLDIHGGHGFLPEDTGEYATKPTWLQYAIFIAGVGYAMYRLKGYCSGAVAYFFYISMTSLLLWASKEISSILL
ncbi:hypothetical protein LCM08_26515 [Salipiger pacificus]|nr:hypothetical protein [Alloyangia pacifica]